MIVLENNEMIVISGEELDERLRRKKIVRGGKKIKVRRSTKKGYTFRGGRETRMGSKEKRNRKLAQRKGARKRRAKKSQSMRSRKRSLRKKRSWR